jgi:hypothetical protein
MAEPPGNSSDFGFDNREQDWPADPNVDSSTEEATYGNIPSTLYDKARAH